MPIAEKEILKKLSNGDVKALDILYRLYAAAVRNYCFALLQNEAEAEDLTQDVFLKIWKARNGLCFVNSFKSYLFTVSHNAVMNKLREIKVRQIFIAYENKDGAGNSQDPIDTKDVSVQIDSKELLSDVRKSLDSMSDIRRKIFEMSRIENMTYQEIAVELGISPKTVQYHITCCLKDLRRLL